MSHDPRVLLQKADKALSSASGGWSLFGGRTEKYENAVDLYKEAGNAFRAQNMNREAGQAYEKAASIEENKPLEEVLDAANTLQDAFKVYRKSMPEDAARVLSKAIGHYFLRNPRRAATQLQSLAELYEKELGDEKKALDAYQKATDLFESDNSDALANRNRLKVGELAAIIGDYKTAIEAFDTAAEVSKRDRVTSFSTKDYYFKAGLCTFVENDGPASRNFIRNHDPDGQASEQKTGFAATNEFRFLSHLLNILIEPMQNRMQHFDDLMAGFRNTLLLDSDPWKLTILVRIKRNLPESATVNDASAPADDLEDDFS